MPWDRFFSVALPLARPGFLTAIILAFAHTVGEFGVVLMLGGNIPGETRVLSVAIYNHVEAMEYGAAHWLAGGMVLFSFVVLLGLYLAGGKCWRDDAMSDDTRRLQDATGKFCAGCRFHCARGRRHCTVRSLRFRQDHAAALHRRAGACRRLAA